MTVYLSKAHVAFYRYEVPYGMWTTPTEEILFNRSYHPLLARDLSRQTFRRIARGTFVLDIERQTYFYSDSTNLQFNAKNRFKCLQVLTEFIRGRDVLPFAESTIVKDVSVTVKTEYFNDEDEANAYLARRVQL